MKILVAVDGSPYSIKALDFLAENRTMFVDGHHLVLLHVCPGIPGHVARHVSKEVVEDFYAEEHAKVIEPVKAQLAERSITGYAVEHRHGHAAEQILEAAHDIGAGLIVMGTHGHGLMGRALMGSITTKVLSETDLSVLLVK